jgi:hypothetical protein
VAKALGKYEVGMKRKFKQDTVAKMDGKVVSKRKVKAEQMDAVYEKHMRPALQQVLVEPGVNVEGE